jgi:sugar/nucleoside kinase (ribokinase family)
MAVLTLGEALVDLICQRPVRDVADVDAFVPHFGGATANVAVNAVRAGGRAALLGGAGDDWWGGWLLAALEREGVDTRAFSLDAGGRTPLAFAVIGEDGDATYAFYGDSLGAGVARAGARLEAALEGAGGLFFGGNTLVEPDERAVTLRAAALARESGARVCFDPNLRLNRWASEREALEVTRTCVEGAFLVKANREEAQRLTGKADPAAAAETLAAAGPTLAVVTLGAEGALVRGAQSLDVPGAPARLVSTVGAGDALMGVLLAHLDRSDWEPDLAAALPEAVRTAARVTESWGAVA